ncbi:DUF6371 domain-containing protein [Pontibacter korlensis]|uniref:DUF6371 domain-containing protein n=1 Tax=Pontibacter korlensis TaxID=400092 RepID=UPI00061B2749
MTQHRFTLEPYGNGRSTRFSCPSCGKKRQFTRYIDTETGRHLHDSVGSCNRKSKCGYHYTPKQYFADNPHLQEKESLTWAHPTAGKVQPSGNPNMLLRKPSDAQLPVSYIPDDKFRESRRHYGQNNFTLFLRGRFGKEAAEKLISRYHVGTSKKWPGATIFWQLDREGKVRTGKIMLYDKSTGKRVKKPYAHLTWVHKALGLEEYNLRQCLFGEHLLGQFPSKPVAVVESEKTAIICSLLLPRYVWLALGGLSMLTAERCRVLKGREVTLFPDLGGYEKWKEKAQGLQDIASFTVSDLLERIASERQREEGLDIADFLLVLPTSP